MGFVGSGFGQDFEWAKSMGGNSNDYGNSIYVDVSGNVYSTGYFRATVDFDPGSGIFNLTSADNYDVFIQKLDSSGNSIWVKSMGGSLGSDKGYSIFVDDYGNVYITGYFQDTVDFDPGPGVFNLSSSGGDDVFVQKLDTSGNFIWAKGMGGTSFDKSTFIYEDLSGNVYTVGNFKETVDFDPGSGIFNLTSAAYDDVFVQKLDSSGNFVWAKSLEGTSYVFGESIYVDALGNVYTTGNFRDTVDFDLGAGVFNLSSAGDYDVFVQKLDASGNFVWAKRMGETSPDYGISIQVDTSGDVYITGYFQDTVDFDQGSGLSNLVSAGFDDVFVQKLDASGNFVWAKRMGEVSDAIGKSIYVDASGNVYTTGYFQDTVDFDSSPGISNIVSVGNRDIFILKLSQSTGTPITEVPYNTIDINIYSNPTTGNINLELGELKDVSIKVHSIDGQLIYSKENINESIYDFDIKDAVSGVYIIEVEANEGKIHYKLVKH